MWFYKVESDKRCFIPVVLIKNLIGGEKIISLPFSDHCSPIYNDKKIFLSSFNEIKNFGRENNFKQIEIRSLQNDFDLNYNLLRLDYIHFLNLSNDINIIFKSFSSNHKRNIKKSESQKISVIIKNDRDGIEIFYDMVCYTRKKQGLPPQPKDFYLNILENVLLNQGGNLFLAKIDRQFIAGAIFFHNNRNVIYKFGASYDKLKEFRGNHSVMWNAIKFYKDAGYDKLDFGRTEIHHKNLRLYKLGWGSEEKNIFTFTYDIKTDNFIKSKSKTTGTHNIFFKMMPIPILKIIGKIFYKYAT